MSYPAQFITRVYGLLLRLYPRQFRVEFGDEMQCVFADLVNDAAKRGLTAVLMVCAREMWELPRNVACEHWRGLQKGSVRMNDTAALDGHPSSWLGTLTGALPFLLLGPIRVLLAYPDPHPAWRGLQGITLLMSTIYPLFVLVGLVVGWRARWPRWSFPYLTACALVLDFQINQLRNWITLAAPRAFRLEPAWLLGALAYPLFLALFVLVPGLALVLICTVRWLRPLYLSIRRDWTQLSFGLSVVSVLMLSGVDYDEDPRLTLAVILPGVIVLSSAVAHLRSTNKIQRVLSLLLGLIMAVTVSIWRHWYYILYGMFLAGIVFLPAALELLRPQNKPMPAE
jgi:hypothetical protein